MNIPVDLTIEFKSERFDYVGEFPPDANAGNCFYGKDLAEFLCAELEQYGVFGEYMDEDWGWLVLAHENSVPMIEMCVYHWQDENSSPQNIWRIRIASYVHDRFLYFFNKRRFVANSDSLVSALRTVFDHADFQVSIFGESADW
jgi:hypothetical protein